MNLTNTRERTVHPRLEHPMRESIFTRQYAVEEGEDFLNGMIRIVKALYPNDLTQQEALLEVLLNGEGQFGGRVIAGAGTEHGNLLNCFVQAEPKGKRGTTEGVLQLAKNLALVTKVGGGNGVNLDDISAKGYVNPDYVGGVWFTIDPNHPDAKNVVKGRYMNLVTGEYEKPGYKVLERAHYLDDRSRFNDVVRVRDSVEGIWDAAAEMVHAMLAGRNVLIDLSKLRPEGDKVSGSGGASSGPASFAVEVFDNFARWARLGGAAYAGPVATLRYIYAPTLRSIRQGGVRRGAGMATLSIHHPDLYDFITSKDLEREQLEGDIGTFNISVLADADDVALQDQASKKLRAVAEHAWATGEPGLLFSDTINKHNMAARTQGKIKATNPCGEIGLYPGEPCDLGAINLAAFVRDDYDPYVDGDAIDQADNVTHAKLNHQAINLPRLRDVTRIMVDALDTVLDVEKPPLREIAEAIQRNRRIGLGFMGLADMLIRLGVPYDSEEGRAIAEVVTMFITEAASQRSEERGVELGVPEGVKEAQPYSRRRNIAIMTVAPTGTISMMTGVSGGVEPVFSGITYRRIGTEYHAIVHPLLEELLNEHLEGPPAAGFGWNWDAIKKDISDANGSIQEMLDNIDRGESSAVREDPRLEAFITAQEIHANDHVRMQAAVQRGFDLSIDGKFTFAGNSISKTINMPNEATVEDVLAAYELAAEKGCKGCTVYRDGSRDLQVLNTKEQETDSGVIDRDVIDDFFEDMNALAYEEDVDDEVDLEEINTLVHRDNPAPGFSYKYRVAGTKVYVQVFFNHEGQLVEVFTPAPKGSNPNERTAHSIIGRLISLALKYGVPIDDIAQVPLGHMDESGGISPEVGYVSSRWDVVSHALRDARDRFRVIEDASEEETTVSSESSTVHRATSVTNVTDPCPDCGSELARESGCLTCHTCGFSKCG